MPRPKESTEQLKLEVRLTPLDQRPILFENDLKEFNVLLVAEEGTPNGAPRLHYHVYLETDKSKSWVRSWILKTLEGHYKPEDKPNGNSMYFTRTPHDHTIPYVVKSGNVCVRIGVTQSTLDEYFKQSDEYNKAKSTERKRKQRDRDTELLDVYKQVEKDLQTNSIGRTVGCIIDRFLAICNAEEVRFPAKSQMDQFVLKLIYPYDESIPRLYYSKSFEFR